MRSSSWVVVAAALLVTACGDNNKLTVDGGPGTGRPQCFDNQDNDGDGKIDFPDDPGCDDESDDSEDSAAKPQCSDHRDNDGDALAVSKDGQAVACGGANHTVRVFDVKSGKEQNGGPAGRRWNMRSNRPPPKPNSLSPKMSAKLMPPEDPSRGPT